jgi:type I restriction enzyme S subunit
VLKRIEPSLLLFALLNGQRELLGRVESSGHGTGKLPSEILLSYPIAMPRMPVQKRLAVQFDCVNDRTASSNAESRTLTALRDTLLPKLLSGELSVAAVESVLEAVG